MYLSVILMKYVSSIMHIIHLLKAYVGRLGRWVDLTNRNIQRPKTLENKAF